MPRDERRRYAAAGFLIGLVNLALMMTLIEPASLVRLAMTNGTSSSPAYDLPASGTWLLGMRERLTAVDGSLSTLEADGCWTASAAVPLEPPPALLQETPP